jgi:hypothetical protein
MRDLIKLLVVALLIGVLIGILIMGTSGVQQLLGWNQVTTAEVIPSESIQPNAQAPIVVLDKRTVVREMSALNRLETQSAVVQTEFTLSNAEAQSIWSFFSGESLSMAGQGTVIAGVDLANINENTVTISEDGTYVRVELPESQVFALTIDQDKTGVVQYDQGILVFDDGMELNEKANAKVHDELLNKACEAGITLKAADVARDNVTQLVRALNPNVRDVDVVVSAGDCKTIAPAK